MKKNTNNMDNMEMEMKEGVEGSVPPADKLEEVRNDLAEIIKNEQLMGVAENDSTVCRLLERNITKASRILSGFDPEKKIKFKFEDEEEQLYSGPELAKRFTERKRSIQRVVPKLEKSYSMTDPYLKVHVGPLYTSSAHTKSSPELDMAMTEGRASSWDEYKKDLDELYEDMLRTIMMIEPKTFPLRENVISEKMTTEKILGMVADAKARRG
jgi:hypothetical protein